MKQKILGTGFAGFLGTRLRELLQDQYDCEVLENIDIRDKENLDKAFSQSNAHYVLHLAAKAFVDECEKEKKLGRASEAWTINVNGTQNVVDAAKKTGKKVLTISTDFVFDGTKDEYAEKDEPHPINWYGVTKYESEKITLTDSRNVVVRLAYPYGLSSPLKKDFLTTIISLLRENKIVFALTDHIFTPTYIDDIARGIDTVIQKNVSGPIHIVGSSSLTPFAAACEIAHVFGFSEELVRPTTRAEFFKNRAPRPYKLNLKNATITSLGIHMKTFSEGIAVLYKKGFAS